MSPNQTTLLDAQAVERTLRRMAEEIVELNDGPALFAHSARYSAVPPNSETAMA